MACGIDARSFNSALHTLYSAADRIALHLEGTGDCRARANAWAPSRAAQGRRATKCRHEIPAKMTILVMLVAIKRHPHKDFQKAALTILQLRSVPRMLRLSTSSSLHAARFASPISAQTMVRDSCSREARNKNPRTTKFSSPSSKRKAVNSPA